MGKLVDYCNYSKDKFDEQISVIQPPGMNAFENDRWWLACETAERIYLSMTQRGCSPQIARSVLPICLKTEIWCTANYREWQHILKLRTSKKAHPQIRSLMLQVQKLLQDKIPEIFGDSE